MLALLYGYIISLLRNKIIVHRKIKGTIKKEKMVSFLNCDVVYMSKDYEYSIDFVQNKFPKVNFWKGEKI